MLHIRYNVPDAGDREGFDAEPSYTLHTDAVTVYFDTIRDTTAGYVFAKDGTDVAWVASRDCAVSPEAARRAATDTPNERIPFTDAPDDEDDAQEGDA